MNKRISYTEQAEMIRKAIMGVEDGEVIRLALSRMHGGDLREIRKMIDELLASGASRFEQL